jgi:hypothetical protein
MVKRTILMPDVIGIQLGNLARQSKDSIFRGIMFYSEYLKEDSHDCFIELLRVTGMGPFSMGLEQDPKKLKIFNEYVKQKPTYKIMEWATFNGDVTESLDSVVWESAYGWRDNLTVDSKFMSIIACKGDHLPNLSGFAIDAPYIEVIPMKKEFLEYQKAINDELRDIAENLNLPRETID